MKKVKNGTKIKLKGVKNTHCYLLVWLYGIKKVKNGTKIKLKGGQKHKIGHIEDNNEVRVP